MKVIIVMLLVTLTFVLRMIQTILQRLKNILPSGQCPDSASDLRGYRWITGDNATDFQNWGGVDDWMQAPWNCEVLKGGCEDLCLPINQQPVCICPPGKFIHYNKCTCEDAQNDPCLHFGCAQVCYKINDNSIACMCHHGYALAENGKECKDIDDCDDERQCR
ncbi:unnamed protein product [Coregonus sp. 'balchen']|nr:unnamed protein product [Coregonus sp. 'balchen']